MKKALIALASAGVTSLWWCLGTFPKPETADCNPYLVAGIFTSIALLVWLVIESVNDNTL